ncbi:class I SAM-dependent methyltransferase [Methanoculleus sp. FWC-SCC1]|uniref:Class I SAM-dependent methyltransferase n=1 Tax=Methanoculleus frigidifontis TaxID=2584085 RepID=A0ABT8MAN9_9EURY|nr:class I SAM-dependent methyltransferase [Methanoculleus sp. FWC-SCC1]MDN7025002.1 class I SAM-dependent methyltransferase [Methanoculleus sp. FWC-SCC1]
MTREKHHYHDDRERRTWQNPEAILIGIGLTLDRTFVDIGCGDGFFAIPAAKIVGPRGRAYGIDIDADALDRLRAKAHEEGLTNIFLHQGAAEEILLCKDCADVVFFGIDLHDFDDPARVLHNAREIIRDGGIVVDLDWKKEPQPLGPPLAKRFDADQAVALMECAGFRVVSVAESGIYHYLIVAEPADLPTPE